MISGAGHLYADKSYSVGSTTDRIKALIGYTAEDEIDLYEVNRLYYTV